MKIIKSLVEFLGTYIALFSIIFTANKYPNYIPFVVGLSFASVVYLFSDITSNFNPAITLMMVLAKKQPLSDLVILIIPQLLAAYFAYLTFNFIK
tara:strand:+ start:160 stop:444 length:285 start_codon:yes stop_codon:yes gene_type:complete